MFVDEYIPVSTAKSHLLDVLRRIEERHSKVVITKNGVPKAVLLPYQDFEGLRETIDILADPAMVEGIREGLNDLSFCFPSRTRGFAPTSSDAEESHPLRVG